MCLCVGMSHKYNDLSYVLGVFHNFFLWGGSPSGLPTITIPWDVLWHRIWTIFSENRKECRCWILLKFILGIWKIGCTLTCICRKAGLNWSSICNLLVRESYTNVNKVIIESDTGNGDQGDQDGQSKAFKLQCIYSFLVEMTTSTKTKPVRDNTWKPIIRPSSRAVLGVRLTSWRSLVRVPAEAGVTFRNG